MELKLNRKYKDTLFRKVFNNKKDLLSLYNALNNTEHMEMLVEELASAHRMLELGMTAKMRPQTVEQLPNIISSLLAYRQAYPLLSIG